MSEIRGIILAAGESRRMKSPKMLLPFMGKTIIQNVIENVIASSVGSVHVVVGSYMNDILDVINKLPVHYCYNENFIDGMLSSVKCGFSSLPENTDAAVIFLGDQPRLRPEITDMLINAYRKTGKRIIMPVFKNRRGHPLLIDFKYRDEILILEEGTGLKGLARNHPGDVLEVETNSEEVLKDIDTQEDYYCEINQIS